MQKLKGELVNISGGKVLDVCTGNGSFINLLMILLKDFSEIIGIDNIDSGFPNKKNLLFIKMDANKLAFANETFDTVCISNSLHHLPDPNNVLAEMLRALKPNGTFIINEMFSDNQSEKQLTHVYLHHLSGDIDRTLGAFHNKTYKKQEIIDISKNLNLNHLRYFEYHYPQTEEMTIIDLENMKEKILAKINKSPDYIFFEKKFTEITNRFNSFGFENATQLFLIGKK